MLKNIEGKEVDSFEQAMEHTIADIDSVTVKSIGGAFAKGQRAGCEYALAIYRGCQESGTI
ncbi:MAG: hypothetical protein DRI69_07605 [Bacteroidetes bacterium]|nr:MAG: hypothetical protein DRI69_07605 [Bacteroidota bacterium]